MQRSNKNDLPFQDVLRLNPRAVGLALGTMAGLVLFVMTNWLVLKGGDPMGPNLQLLSQFLIGYRVSLAGSLIGLFYGFAYGALAGMLLALLYNTISAWRKPPGEASEEKPLQSPEQTDRESEGIL